MADGLDVREAMTAFEADCGNWIPVGGRYLVTAGGRCLCPPHGLAWCMSPAERRRLLGAVSPRLPLRRPETAGTTPPRRAFGPR